MLGLDPLFQALSKPVEVAAGHDFDVQGFGQTHLRFAQGAVGGQHAACAQAPYAAAVFGQFLQGVVGLQVVGVVHAGGFALDHEQAVAGQKDQIQFVGHAASIGHLQVGGQVAQTECAALP